MEDDQIEVEGISNLPSGQPNNATRSSKRDVIRINTHNKSKGRALEQSVDAFGQGGRSSLGELQGIWENIPNKQAPSTEEQAQVTTKLGGGNQTTTESDG